MSNTPPPIGVPAGYSIQTALMCERLRDSGYEVAIQSWTHRGSMWRWHDIPIYPAGADIFSRDVLFRAAEDHFDGRDGLIVTLIDNRVLLPIATPMASWNVASFAVIDTDPISRNMADFYETSYAFPIAYSRFGVRQLESIDHSPYYIPHVVEMDVYQSVDRLEARKRLGLPEDIFLVGMVAANKDFPSRKGFPEALIAFDAFQSSRDDVGLYLHTLLTNEQGGVNLDRYLEEMLFNLKGKVFGVDPYQYKMGYPTQFMVDVYSAIDVLLNPSYSGAFEVPVVEALACGTPAIVNNSTAMPEHIDIGVNGWICESQPALGPQYSYHFIPMIDSIVGCLEEAYGNAKYMADAARESVVDRYDADTVFERNVLPVFEDIAQKMF